MMKESFDFWYHEMMHDSSGLTCDNLRIEWRAICNRGWLENKHNQNKLSIAATGWSVLMLTVGAELYEKTNGETGLHEVNAARKIKQILKWFDSTKSSTSSPKWPAVDKEFGSFRFRYVTPSFDDDGNINKFNVSDTISAREGSTIDNAILASAAVFAGRYFARKKKDYSILRAAKKFGRSIDWEKVVPLFRYSNPCGVKMVAQDDDKKMITQPFSEYQILFATLSEFDRTPDRRLQKLYSYCYASSDASDMWKRSTYEMEESSLTTFTDVENHFRSSFVPQFQTFLTKTGSKNDQLASNLEQVLQADRAWFRKLVDDENYPYFGMGPGPNIHSLSYDVLEIGGENEEHVFSPPIMAGFLTSRKASPRIKQEILSALRDLFLSAAYVTPKDNRVLWRYSAKELKKGCWTEPKIIQLDYVNFPLGMSTRYLGHDFFQRFAIL